MKTWLVLDVPYLMHLAFHSMGHLSWKGDVTGATFGFLKSLLSFKDEFQTDYVAFCFDHPHLFRKEQYPAYKQNRTTRILSQQEQKTLNNLRQKIALLRSDYLPRIGFKNLFQQDGFEADDLMAILALNLRESEEMILISGDSDLWQLLVRPEIQIYHPQRKRLLTGEWLQREYGISPLIWWKVKALAGCATDGIPGIPRIGEKTAVKYLRGELKQDTASFLALESPENQITIALNECLVRLPLPGVLVPKLQEDQIDSKGWKEVCSELGMRSLAGRPPVATRIGGR